MLLSLLAWMAARAGGAELAASGDGGGGESRGPDSVALPEGVRVAWNLGSAYRETTPTRQRVCLNGLWRWQPAGGAPEEPVPVRNWGFFKVPGSWPGITDYMQKDSQSVVMHPAWGTVRMSEVVSAWYEREFTVPAEWTGRRVALTLDLVQSHAVVHVDGARVGEARFPDGEVDLTQAVRPGGTHRLGIRVTAMPLAGVLRSYTDSAAAREVKGSVARRGLCGDVFLTSMPRGPRVAEARVETSVRRGEITIRAALANLAVGDRYGLRARVRDPEGRVVELAREEVVVAPTAAADTADAPVVLVRSWRPERLWDTASPGHRCELELILTDAAGTDRDAFWRQWFGFREFWIEGRDFMLNGTRLHLSTVPLDNAQVGAAWASYAGARDSLERLRDFGINFVYTHNYDCLPGSHLAFEEILRAADDVGMLVALTQPHFSHYDWKGADAGRTNGYARHAEYYARVAGSHPSVVMYATSHNSTGYNEDMNPDMIDGLQAARDAWAERNVVSARRAEAIIRTADSSRIVYHHASGNLGPLHAINFYPNFAPIQELSDWFGHWATRGVKPAFLCEYGAPFSWDWTMYRGWYQGEREFGSARVPWEFCVAEWNAQFLGDRAFPASEVERANLRWEARQFRAGNRWHRWDYPAHVGSDRLDERYPIFAAYLTDNWRAFRTWGVSVISPWEHGHFWKLRDGVDRGRKELPVDWDGLQRPGFSPDFLDRRYERVDLAYEREDWIATPAAAALYRNNRALLAYLAGPPDRFTAKDHVFHAGETVEKSVVVINDSRGTVTAEAVWSIDLPDTQPGEARFDVVAGGQERRALRIPLPETLPPGRREIRLRVRFDSGEVQEDRFAIEVLSRPEPVPDLKRVALFDPAGRTGAWMRGLGRPVRLVGPDSDLSDVDVLVVGQGALTADGPAPDLARVRAGLRVVIFEQTSEVLERRFGFRVTEYGLRQVFPRVPDHPVLAGLAAGHLRDWRGEATLLPSRLKYEMRPRQGPTVRWCDLPVTRLWRCGNRGNVASVLIEKPARGDFLPIVDGGYALQYSPLLEYREGSGMVLFCQMDVTGRTAADPASETLALNVLRHALTWRPNPARRAVYAGDPAGLARLRALGFAVEPHAGGRLESDQALILGPGGAGSVASAGDWVAAGGRVLAFGLGADDLGALPWLPASVKIGEHLSTGLPAFGRDSRFAGVAPAEVHLREPRDIPRITGLADGSTILGDGIFGERGGVTLCQVVPWQFDGRASMNLKRTERRVSVLCSRLVANLGVPSSTPLLERFARPEATPGAEKRWLTGFYLDTPEEWDDPYRFFRW